MRRGGVAAADARSVRRPAPRMKIELKKRKNGRPSLTCARGDGTRTWAQLHPFFPLHDLTHCAVESVLGFDQAFFGLVSSGWAIDDFSARGALARLPTQAHWAECIVGLLDRETAAGARWPATEFNQLLAASLQGQNVAPFRVLGDAELEKIRQLRDDLQARWIAVAPGETLEVMFPATAVAWQAHAAAATLIPRTLDCAQLSSRRS